MASKKMKILYLLKILMEKTDMEKGITINEIISDLEQFGISAERKSIYDDVDMINDSESHFGFFIEKIKIGKNVEYRLVSRKFETLELKFLIDCVLGSKSLSKKRSKELIDKLLSFTSKNKALDLKHQIRNFDETKTSNKVVSYTLDNIENAMKLNKRISFVYNVINKDKALIPKNEERYIVSPWHTLQDDGKYYLLGYDEKSGIIKTYRIDKMTETKIEDLKRLGEKEFKKTDITGYSRTHFSMYGGNQRRVTLLCSNEMSNVVLDRFGTDVTVTNIGKDKFKVVALVHVSKQFFGWLLSIGDSVMLEGPEDVKEELKLYLEGINRLYY